MKCTLLLLVLGTLFLTVYAADSETALDQVEADDAENADEETESIQKRQTTTNLSPQDTLALTTIVQQLLILLLGGNGTTNGLVAGLLRQLVTLLTGNGVAVANNGNVNPITLTNILNQLLAALLGGPGNAGLVSGLLTSLGNAL